MTWYGNPHIMNAGRLSFSFFLCSFSVHHFFFHHLSPIHFPFSRTAQQQLVGGGMEWWNGAAVYIGASWARGDCCKRLGEGCGQEGGAISSATRPQGLTSQNKSHTQKPLLSTPTPGRDQPPSHPGMPFYGKWRAVLLLCFTCTALNSRAVVGESHISKLYIILYRHRQSQESPVCTHVPLCFVNVSLMPTQNPPLSFSLSLQFPSPQPAMMHSPLRPPFQI